MLHRLFLLTSLYGGNLFATSFPEKLSDWKIFEKDEAGDLDLNGVPYDLINPLFSDYAGKFRSIHIPAGKKLEVSAEGKIVFPVGTILAKSFGYLKKDLIAPDPLRAKGRFRGEAIPLNEIYLLETRLLVLDPNAKWQGMAYVWDEEQKEGWRKASGTSVPIRLKQTASEELSWKYFVPGANQCKQCHTELEGFTKKTVPIGFKLNHLNREYPYRSVPPQNQLERLRGYFDAKPENIPFEAAARDESYNLGDRARAYLDINCGHCHNPRGPAGTSGLNLTPQNTDLRSLGVCKTPVATGNAGDAHRYDIFPGRPEESILLTRLISTDPEVRMPEIGRALRDEFGVKLIEAWILGMDGECD